MYSSRIIKNEDEEEITLGVLSIVGACDYEVEGKKVEVGAGTFGTQITQIAQIKKGREKRRAGGTDFRRRKWLVH